MTESTLRLKNVRVHNLKGIDLTLPSHQFIVFTGVSGSGKSSLAFDTIYMEGQRRYIESLSTYARRHLGDFPKPEADSLEGLSPTIAIEQKTMGKNPRSTVGTLTGIYDFLRVLFAKIATPYCPTSLTPLSPQSPKRILENLLSMSENMKVIILAPYISQKKGEHKEEWLDLRKKGFIRARVNNKILELSEDLSLDPTATHTIEVVIDRLTISHENRSRIAEAVETGLEIGKGMLSLLEVETQKETFFSTHAYSQESGFSYPPLEPQDFSFNHPLGMCPTCQGLGITQEFDPIKVIDPEKSLSENCCKVGGSFHTILYGNIYTNLAKMHKSDVFTPWKELPTSLQKEFLHGTKRRYTRMEFVHPQKGKWMEQVEWRGVLYDAKQRYGAAQSDVYKKNMEPYLQETICPSCLGSRLKPYPSHAKLHGKTIQEVTDLSIEEAFTFFSSLPLSSIDHLIADELLKEICQRLTFLKRVGLSYISLARFSPTLSGGEGQRVRLASQIGSGLVGSTYILDEPSIGLHPEDNLKLLETLLELKDKGNTVIVVEHDEETILSADRVVDVGPLAGVKGGEILVNGSLTDLLACEDSLTAKYLSGKLSTPPSKERKAKKGHCIILEGATHHNLKQVTLNIPLSLFISVTGVSGSGKSSLILDTLYPAIVNHLQDTSHSVGAYNKLSGVEHIDKVIAIDQAPIGRTPRSNPATYIKVWDEIRDLFATLPSSLALGFAPGRFSFNVKEGCCPVCEGIGMQKIDMDFLADAWNVCEHCLGKRFDEATLSILFKGKNIYDILEMSVLEAHEFFASQPKIRHLLDLLVQVGLGYIKLGQSSPTLSGGEAQRIKLAKELARPSTGKTLYILDEPTTGLHFYDVHNLIEILHKLVDKGNTVLVIEHNMDMVRTSDIVIDLGPKAGPLGGQILFSGTPKALAKENTATGKALALAMKKKKDLTPPILAPSIPLQAITIKGASQNNLKNLNLSIPLRSITVCTGPSGSGKSSLAFETIYAEGQRRYVESMSHYARQFVKQMPKPKVEQIEGLSAAIAIEQKNHAGNPRSTVGTLTEVYDYLRILFKELGVSFCPETKEEIKAISKDFVIDKILSFPLKSKCLILCPLTLSKQETLPDLQEKLLRQGFVRILLEDTLYDLESKEIPWDPKKKHPLFLVVDRLILQEESRSRVTEAVEQVLRLCKDKVSFSINDKRIDFNLSRTVESTGKSYPPITAHSFSFNTEEGMCPSCQGLGFQYGAGATLVNKLSSITPFDLLLLLCKENMTQKAMKVFSSLFAKLNIDPDVPLSDLSKEELFAFFQGSPAHGWRGLEPVFLFLAKSAKGNIRSIATSFLEKYTCSSCQGTRLSPLARHVFVEGISICDLVEKETTSLIHFLENLSLPEAKKSLLSDVIQQMLQRLHLMQRLGIGYLCLNRSAPTLSGGEAQRIRLSRELGTGLTGCLYVLDEPTIGLHPYDNHLLNTALLHLKQLGNTLILVEHDPLTMQIADYILDFGPGAGKHGGKIVAEGSLNAILNNPSSPTGAYLSQKKKIALPNVRRSLEHKISLGPFSLHNLKNIHPLIPLKALTCITGVSGSGKSTLLLDILCPEIEKVLLSKKRKQLEENSPFYEFSVFEKLIVLEQDPIGTTSRADVCTYTELLAPLRHLYSSLPEAKARGLLPKHFSYNHKKGMCPSCQGLGTRTVSLQFLPPVKVPCESCNGFRLSPLPLSVYFKGKNFGEILSLSVLEAKDFFSSFPKIIKILDTLIAVGLSYLTLGQEVASLSGGEAQRLRLSCELSKRSAKKTIYMFDEPSIGLHMEDIAKIIPIFQNLVDLGGTVIIIEHNLDLIAQADYIIDLGPGAGPEGGEIVCMGTPEEICNSPISKTGKYLKNILL
jgi:excinuclease ABC subunit A